eukprot:CAMPEP_0183717364 /NCGR_PEP_ID=MMETSP0737-20130205/10998_1 /TAXON_ID=385413 /ORGANISM="Thalassiosira miniscula, Strain CCMP1093" /LENGTH=83 /DNA_ID=CAMNT_0025946787 /DNA_START=106 /DNA_END=353 /DNA_ORIENTATION=-
MPIISWMGAMLTSCSSSCNSKRAFRADRNFVRARKYLLRLTQCSPFWNFKWAVDRNLSLSLLKYVEVRRARPERLVVLIASGS